jgi:hypothetical protein
MRSRPAITAGLPMLDTTQNLREIILLAGDPPHDGKNIKISPQKAPNSEEQTSRGVKPREDSFMYIRIWANGKLRLSQIYSTSQLLQSMFDCFSLCSQIPHSLLPPPTIIDPVQWSPTDSGNQSMYPLHLPCFERSGLMTNLSGLNVVRRREPPSCGDRLAYTEVQRKGFQCVQERRMRSSWLYATAVSIPLGMTPRVSPAGLVSHDIYVDLPGGTGVVDFYHLEHHHSSIVSSSTIPT